MNIAAQLGTRSLPVDGSSASFQRAVRNLFLRVFATRATSALDDIAGMNAHMLKDIGALKGMRCRGIATELDARSDRAVELGLRW